MPLESANNFEQLDKTWPLLGDSMRQTGGHIRLIKAVLKTIFPGVAGQGFAIPINATEAELDRTIGVTSNIQSELNTLSSNSILVSAFIPYSGPLASIPANYQLCNGTNGTPDLTDSFIMGTAVEGEIGQTGGSADKIVVAHSHTMNHNHSVIVNPSGAHTHALDGGLGSVGGGKTVLQSGDSASAITAIPTDSGGNHFHTVDIDNKVVTTSTDGVSALGANDPAFVKLAFIMRIS